MKYDAQVKITMSTSESVLPVNTLITIPIDYDCVDDFDDVIRAVEHEIYKRYNVIMHYVINFDIINAMDICSDIFES